MFYSHGRLRCYFPEVLHGYRPRHSPEVKDFIFAGEGQGSHVVSEGRVSPGVWVDQEGRGGGCAGAGGGVSHRHGVHSSETAGRVGAGRRDGWVGAPLGRGDFRRGGPERCEKTVALGE